MISSSYTEVARSPGVLTKEDLIKIKTYVRNALFLPSGLLEVVEFLKYRTCGIAGLEPEDILILFQKIKLHALSWEIMQDNVIQQNTSLKLTASKVIDNGNQIISAIKKMPLMARISDTLEDFSDTELEGMKYTTDDDRSAFAIGDIIQLMAYDIAMAHWFTQQVKDRITDFKVELAGGELSDGNQSIGLQSDVDLKYQILERNDRIKSIADNKALIATKTNQITQLAIDYDYYVKMSFSAGLPILWWISASIYGPKAETTRKERNKLQAEVNALNHLVTNQENLQRALDSTKANFADLAIRMLGAEASLNILNTMWQTILSNLNASMEQFAGINDALRLSTFATDFANVIAPWADVRHSADKLQAELTAALDEFERSVC
ncbi:alpha-xenorhabdolysin family binary toxin subunit A [Pseudomonas arsenicoxydans]|nr:alpha-xenorhabdolysin family binary toxin subunit A [Pseudomonas arsenicoxydans]